MYALINSAITYLVVGNLAFAGGLTFGLMALPVMLPLPVPPLG